MAVNSSYRQDRIREQIAHLRVLLASAEEALRNDHQNIAAWHKNVLIHEAEIGTFYFRINEFEDEIRSLNAKPRAKAKAKQ